MSNASNNTLPKGIIYQLVVQSTDIQKSKAVVTEYHYLRKIMTDGKFQYQFGKYETYEDVSEVKAGLTKVGCKNVEILAYNNHIEIPVSEAISLQYKSDIIEERADKKRTPKSITTKEVNYLIQVQQSGLKHYYSLAIPISSVETVDMILEEIDDEQVIEISIDDNLYSIGRYESFEEVIAARKQFIEGEIYDVFIMAQITDDRINTEDTNNLALTIQSVVNELASK
jgi:hypothetical protein